MMMTAAAAQKMTATSKKAAFIMIDVASAAPGGSPSHYHSSFFPLMSQQATTDGVKLTGMHCRTLQTSSSGVVGRVRVYCCSWYYHHLEARFCSALSYQSRFSFG